MPRPKNDLPQISEKDQKRFWSKVRKEEGDGCWMWTACTSPKGYGVFMLNGRYWRAHRVSWLMHFGTIPKEAVVCHRCDVPGCQRPDHLWLGSPAENIADCVTKGRSASGAKNGAYTKPEKVRRGETQGLAKLVEDNIRTIRAMAASGMTQKDIAIQFNIHWTNVGYIVRRRTWKHVT